jgi:hypothetical protein
MTINSTMSKLLGYLYFDTQTPALRQRLVIVIAAIRPAHLLRPVKNEFFADPENAFIRIRD